MFKILITSFVIVPGGAAAVFTQTETFPSREEAEIALNEITAYTYTGEYNFRQRAIALYK